MLIEVTETHPAGPGKKVAHVVAKDGQKLEIWPEKLAGIHIGKSYEVEVEDREYQGRTIRKITKATLVNGTAHPGANGNGAAHPTANGNGSAPAASSITDEAAFVREVLSALIIKGDVVYTKKSLYDATLLLRDLYGATFGGRMNGNGGGHG